MSNTVHPLYCSNVLVSHIPFTLSNIQVQLCQDSMAIVPREIYQREFVGQTTIPDVAFKSKTMLILLFPSFTI